MTLSEKLNCIDFPRLASFGAGKADIISDFWESFVKPNLIPEDIISQWCNLLYKYVEDVGAVYAIRAFNDRKENDDKNLRRGFVTKTDKNYSFFYTDNYFSAYFLKMAMDRFVPDYAEFKEMMVLRKFPARFGQSCKLEKNKAAYKIDGKDPRINSQGYKISHIFDVGTGYFYKNTICSISQICNKYFPRGNYDDWTIITDNTGTYYSRFLSVAENALPYLKAIFLRMTCPLNYILTPKKKLHTTKVKVDKNDIGECVQLQQYAMYQFSKIYGDTYKDFLNRIMIQPDCNFSLDSGNHYVGIEYDINLDADTIIHPVTKPDADNKKNNPSASIILTDKLKAECIKAYLFDGLSFRRIEMDVMHIDSPARGGGFKAQTLMRSYNISSEMKGVFSNYSLEDFYQKMKECKSNIPPVFKLMFSELL